MTHSLDQQKYPIGKFIQPEIFNNEQHKSYVTYTRSFPQLLRNEVQLLNDVQLNTPYREEGWTIRQVVHHLADSHMNALIRFKLTLTEESPTIRPYKEELWAKLPDAFMPIEASLKIVEGVHERMGLLWSGLSKTDLEKKYIHPQYQAEYTLAHAMGLYDWHAKHHLAHISSVKVKNKW